MYVEVVEDLSREWTTEERALCRWFLLAYSAGVLPKEKFYLARPFMVITQPEYFYWACEAEAKHTRCETVRAITGAFQSDLRLLRAACGITAEADHANVPDLFVEIAEEKPSKAEVPVLCVLPESDERRELLCDLF
jgi:hypothetical protein